MKGFIIGVGVGYGVGLLFAPDAGSQTRKKVKERLNSALNMAKDQLPESARPIVNSVAEQFEQVFPSRTEAVRSDTGDMTDEATRLLEIFNTASKTKLMSVSGIGDATARRIIDGRPYDSSEKAIGDGILSEDVLRNLKKELLETEAA